LGLSRFLRELKGYSFAAEETPARSRMLDRTDDVSVSAAHWLAQFEGALASLRSRAIRLEHWDLHVLGRGESRQEVKRLENKPDLASTVCCRIGMIRQRYSAVEKGSGCRSIQGTE